MAGEGVSSLIILSASIAVALIVSSAIFFVAYHMRDSMENREKIEENYLKSKIIIINDLAYSPYNNTTHNLTLYVKNIGSTVLDMNHTILIVNGTAYSLKYPEINPINGNAWAPQVVVKLSVKISPLKHGDYIATVIGDYGVKDSIKFRV